MKASEARKISKTVQDNKSIKVNALWRNDFISYCEKIIKEKAYLGYTSVNIYPELFDAILENEEFPSFIFQHFMDNGFRVYQDLALGRKYLSIYWD